MCLWHGISPTLKSTSVWTLIPGCSCFFWLGIFYVQIWEVLWVFIIYGVWGMLIASGIMTGGGMAYVTAIQTYPKTQPTRRNWPDLIWPQPTRHLWWLVVGFYHQKLTLVGRFWFPFPKIWKTQTDLRTMNIQRKISRFKWKIPRFRQKLSRF